MDNIPVPIMMNAVVLDKLGAAPTVKQVLVPTPELEHQVLIKVDSSPINPSDLMFMKGMYGSTKVFPTIAGFEGAGVVVSPGKLQGKRVSFVAAESSGTYAEYALANLIMCIPVDDQITLQQASCSFVNPVTVIGMLDVVQKANVTAVVQTAAASQLGRMMIRYFKENNVKVINVVRRQDQVEILKYEGAEYILNSSDANFLTKLHELSTQLHATICFDAVGGEMTGQILSVLPNKSIIYLYGCLSGNASSNVSALDLIFKEKTLTGFMLDRWLKQSNKMQDSFLKVQKMLGSEFKTEIAKEFPLEQFDEAIKFYSQNMSLGKTLIRPVLRQ